MRSGELVPPNPRILYVYMQADVARICLQRGNLDPVPSHLRSNLGEVVALEIPPYDTNIRRRTVAQQYRRAQCNARPDDMDFFVAVPHSSRWIAGGRAASSVYQSAFATRHHREAQGVSDVVVLVGPALFRGENAGN
ncbi:MULTISPECIES: RolB family protein [Rhizobium]|uniref:RolB family protein n=1 Tax=Rhizobium TaxID=379 RepID=UPI0035C8A335